MRSECINWTPNEVKVTLWSFNSYFYRHKGNDLQQGIVHAAPGNSGNNVGAIPVKAKRSKKGGFFYLYGSAILLLMCPGTPTVHFNSEMLNFGFL